MPTPTAAWREDPARVRPMLASLADAPLDDPHLAYEPKYDGIRALVDLEPDRPSPRVRIFSRQGNDKTSQFPEIARALAAYARGIKAGVLLDGEIVALDARGEPTGFQQLQGRIHLTRASDVGAATTSRPVAFIAFDILRDGGEDLRSLPLTARRARLERVFVNPGSDILRLSEFVPADGLSLHRRAVASGWEGLVAKHLDSRYRSGQRSPDWRKLKLTRQQEFVIGGWTEPRKTRGHFGALLLGVQSAHGLKYVGHTGTGFTHAELERVFALLRPLEQPTSPFVTKPQTNERPHWVEPRLVAQVRFTEWTDDNKLRHPSYLGLRDDVKAEEVKREGAREKASGAEGARGEGAMGKGRGADGTSGEGARGKQRGADRARGGGARGKGRGAREREAGAADREAIVEQLLSLESRGADGVLELPGGSKLAVSNLRKVFWPRDGITKGELLRYYVQVSPFILPILDDRALVMKRFPNGVRGKAFYQQRAPEAPPDGVRIETLPDDTEVPSRVIGGSLISLLYMTQLASISQDPWFSRLSSLHCPDQVAIDLDPMPGVTFDQVLEVAQWVREELLALRVEGYPKTSGADGLHIYIPLQPDTSYETAVVFAQLVATLVAQKHPRQATVTRSVHARGRTVYVDYLQNVRGKTLAAAYSARASEFAGVSTPLTWEEVEAGVDREQFTVRTMGQRLQQVGDLWAGLRSSRGTDLRAVLTAATSSSSRAAAAPASSAGAARGRPSARATRR